MRVLFLGNQTVGVCALKVLLEQDEVVGVVAHPPDPEDGVQYLSVYDFAVEQGVRSVRMKGRDPALVPFVQEVKPDLIWVTDFRYLLPAEVFSLAPSGAVNLHPSLLPKYRGRAPVNWGIIRGEREFGLTAHFIDEGMDTGDIIVQERYLLDEHEDIDDALNKLYPLYESITRQVMNYFRSGTVPRRPQDHSQASEFPRRKPEDGRIDWTQSAREVCDLIRAVARPYPGAFSFCRGRKIFVWRAALGSEENRSAVPGQVVKQENEDFAVQTGQGTLWIKEAQDAESGAVVRFEIGDVFEGTL